MEKKVLNVTNRSDGSVIYRVPEQHIRREFYPQETKTVPYDEILMVAAQPGGRELIYNYLFVEDANVLHEGLNVKEDPEYWLKEGDIPTWLNSCSINEFKDALDFAPNGIKDLIKKYSVSVPLNDVVKRDALKKQLGFDVTGAIAKLEDAKEDNAPEIANTKRRTDTPSYAVKPAIATTKAAK